MTKYCLTVACSSRRGIVAAIAGFLSENGCNITDSSQFDDVDTGRFFMRVSFSPETGKTLQELDEAFAEIAASFEMNATFYDESVKMKVVVMVSRFGHCLNDLLYRWRIGALPIDIVAVISNHMDYQKVVVNHDIPYHCIRVMRENKAQAEAEQMRIVRETGAELSFLHATCRCCRTKCAKRCRGASSTSTIRSCRRSRARIPTSRLLNAA